jgi:hypothetical protein
MAEPIFFAPLRVPLIDQRTGLMAREWYLFFQALWLRTGGATAPNTDDLLQNPSDSVGTPDILALLAASFDAVEQLPGTIAELRAKVAELAKEIDALKQGPVI